MILIDYREELDTKKKLNLDLISHIQRQNVEAISANLEFGDAAFEIQGPDGMLLVGVERKRLHDMLNCIDDARYNAQRIGMKENYDISVLMVEGHWKPHDPEGHLMEGYSGGLTWGYARPRGQRALYAKLYRYLISVRLSGVILDYTRDPFHTAFNLCEWWRYGQKRWDDHTSLRELHKINIPTLNRAPSLKQKWANAIEGIGVKKRELAARHFRTPLAMAKADEEEWLCIPGVGVKMARDIVREIWTGNR